MGRQVRRFPVEITAHADAYATGDQIGTLQTIQISSAGRVGAEITLITVLDLNSQKSALDLFFFDRSVTVAADNAAASFSDADMRFCLGVVNVLVADYDDNAANSIATVNPGNGFPVISSTAGVNLFLAVVSRGAPDYNTGPLVVTVTANLEDGLS